MISYLYRVDLLTMLVQQEPEFLIPSMYPLIGMYKLYSLVSLYNSNSDNK